MESLLSNNEKRFIVHDARWAKVTNEWKNYVSIYAYNRLYFITDGEATLQLKDREIILKPDHCYLLPSFQVVTAKCKDSMTHYFIHFQEQENTMYSPFALFNEPRELKVDRDLTLQLFQSAVGNREQKNLQEFYYLHGALDMLLAPFFANFLPYQSTNNRFIPILKYIDSHIEETIQINDLARIMCLTETHFSHVFKITFNISPKQYILQKKLNYAQNLLLNSDLNINEIAFKLGFNNETYFSRLFKEKVGLSPSQFKKHLI